MEHKIEILSDQIANKIAAGEVVQRPLSVVKELVENSIDAKSTIITIALKNSGLDEISVSDNGIGMNEENVKICLVRHATSKVKSEQDIYKIITLGFRGEALPSIAAVSLFSLQTSTDGIKGYELIKEGDEEQQIEEISCNKGTKIKVKNLFFNTPARFKHLSSTFYELSLIVQYINKAALTNPNVKFELKNNDNVIFSSLGDGKIINVLQKIYNTEIAKNILYFRNKNDDFEVDFYIIKPQYTRSKKNNMHIGVNNRTIKNYAIENMIIKGYGTYLHTNEFPIVFLNIKTDFSLIDINIHPTKEQIKISLIENLENLIVSSIKEALAKEEYISKPKDIKIEDINSPNLEPKEKTIINNLFDMKYSKNKLEKEVKSELETETKNELEKEIKKKVKDEKEKKIEIEETYIENPNIFSLNENFSNENKLDQGEKFKESNVQKNGIFEQIDHNEEQNLIPNGVYIGNHHKTYILYENEKGLYLIDQHAAQERIRYENILSKLTSKKYSFQKILVPQLFNFTSAEFLKVQDSLELLSDLGLILEKFGPNTLRLVEVDTFYMKTVNMKKQISNIIYKVLEGDKLEYGEIIQDICASIACKGAIKAHDYITQADSEILLSQLSICKEPYTCPHGRPIIVNIGSYQIEKMFKRVK